MKVIYLFLNGFLSQHQDKVSCVGNGAGWYMCTHVYVCVLLKASLWGLLDLQS